jgi:DNA repair protein RecN (Recombination protein N)
MQVSKLAGDNVTRTSIRELSADERIDELARMLGGMKITKQTREHAREMLEQGQQQADMLRTNQQGTPGVTR